VSAETPTTYWERRRAGEFEQAAAERAKEAAKIAKAQAVAAPPPDQRVHIPIGSDVELDDAIDAGGGTGGASSLTDLTDVTGEPGPGKSPVADDTGAFPLTPVTTQDDLDNVLNQVAAVTWHDIGAAGEPPFQPNWRNIGDPWSPMRFRILANSTVRLQGTICCDDPTIADATWIPICQLPAEVAPGYNLEFSALTNDNCFSKLYVWEDGQIIWGGYVDLLGGTPATHVTHEPISRLPLNFISWSTVGPIGVQP
jgi:hypothetical protein